MHCCINNPCYLHLEVVTDYCHRNFALYKLVFIFTAASGVGVRFGSGSGNLHPSSSAPVIAPNSAAVNSSRPVLPTDNKTPVLQTKKVKNQM